MKKQFELVCESWDLFESQIVSNAFKKSVGRAFSGGMSPNSMAAKDLAVGIGKTPIMKLQPRNSWQKATKSALIKADPKSAQAQLNRNNLADEIMRQRRDDVNRVKYARSVGVAAVPKSNRVIAQRAADNMSGAYSLRGKGVNPNGSTTHSYSANYPYSV